MRSVFLASELVSILWHSFTDETSSSETQGQSVGSGELSSRLLYWPDWLALGLPGWAIPSPQLIFGEKKRRPEIRLCSQSSESGLKLVSNQFSPDLGVFPGKSGSQSLIIISLITSNGWHYSCPRSVCCRSIVVMVIFTHIPYHKWDKNRKQEVPWTDSVRFRHLWLKNQKRSD